jgi:hypothetical protein
MGKSLLLTRSKEENEKMEQKVKEINNKGKK